MSHCSHNFKAWRFLLFANDFFSSLTFLIIKKIRFSNNVKIAEHVRTFGLFDWNIKLEHYLNTLHKKSGALENSTAMLKLDNHIKNIYNKYFTLNPKEFLDVYEIILEKGLEIVQNAIDELEKISPTDISAEKIKLMGDKIGDDNNG